MIFIDCIGGVAGDMLLAALLDAGADRRAVERALSRTGTGVELSLQRGTRHGISAQQLSVHVAETNNHRHWRQVREIIDRADLGEPTRTWAHEAFRRLAMAEAKVHGITPEEVHFHEVGALDAIADVIGTCAAAATLAPDGIVCSPLPVSSGLTGAAHGQIPLPAPATLEILRECRAPLIPASGGEELVTPTGAALVATLAVSFGEIPRMTPTSIGYGAGIRDTVERPNVVRVIVGHGEHGTTSGRPLCLLETNLDDMIAELVPDVVTAAMAAGALDVWVTPTQMKKGRPGVVFSALAPSLERTAVAQALLRHSTSFGVRASWIERYELERDWLELDGDEGTIRVKRGWLDGKLVQIAPEHDDCAAVAERSQRTVREVWACALAAASSLPLEPFSASAEQKPRWSDTAIQDNESWQSQK